MRSNLRSFLHEDLIQHTEMRIFIIRKLIEGSTGVRPRDRWGVEIQSKLRARFVFGVNIQGLADNSKLSIENTDAKTSQNREQDGNQSA